MQAQQQASAERVLTLEVEVATLEQRLAAAHARWAGLRVGKAAALVRERGLCHLMRVGRPSSVHPMSARLHAAECGMLAAGGWLERTPEGQKTRQAHLCSKPLSTP